MISVTFSIIFESFASYIFVDLLLTSLPLIDEIAFTVTSITTLAISIDSTGCSTMNLSAIFRPLIKMFFFLGDGVTLGSTDSFQTFGSP